MHLEMAPAPKPYGKGWVFLDESLSSSLLSGRDCSSVMCFKSGFAKGTRKYVVVIKICCYFWFVLQSSAVVNANKASKDGCSFKKTRHKHLKNYMKCKSGKFQRF